jgi:hypothetical protein
VDCAAPPGAPQDTWSGTSSGRSDARNVHSERCGDLGFCHDASSCLPPADGARSPSPQRCRCRLPETLPPDAAEREKGCWSSWVTGGTDADREVGAGEGRSGLSNVLPLSPPRCSRSDAVAHVGRPGLLPPAADPASHGDRLDIARGSAQHRRDALGQPERGDAEQLAEPRRCSLAPTCRARNGSNPPAWRDRPGRRTRLSPTPELVVARLLASRWVRHSNVLSAGRLLAPRPPRPGGECEASQRLSESSQRSLRASRSGWRRSGTAEGTAAPDRVEPAGATSNDDRRKRVGAPSAGRPQAAGPRAQARRGPRPHRPSRRRSRARRGDAAVAARKQTPRRSHRRSRRVRRARQ